MHVLLVLEQRAMQRRQRVARIVRVQRLGRDVFGQQQLEPVEQFRCRGLLLDARHVAHVEEQIHRIRQQVLLDVREVHVDDLAHRVLVRERDEVEEAAAQEGVRQFLLVIGRDDDDRAVTRFDRLMRFVDVERHAIDFAQQIVREFDIRLVDLVDQQYRLGITGEAFPQRPGHDVVGDIVDLFVAELRIAQARNGVVLVQALLRFRRGLDMPLKERLFERGRDFLGEHGLAGAGLALDQQRALQRGRGVDRELEIIGRDVTVGPGELGGHRRIAGLGFARAARKPLVSCK